MNYDVIIIGGGPAGMSALIWCHSLGLRGLLLDQSPELGGQMLEMYHRVLDYPGLVAENGRELRDHFAAQLDLLRLDYRTGCKIEEVNLSQRRARFDGEWMQGEAIIIATGARKRRLGIPGEDRFEIRGVSFSATRDHSLYAGKKVSVIGGGDSAVQNSLLLARICPGVTLIHRSDRYRAREDWLIEAQENPRITIINNAEAEPSKAAIMSTTDHRRHAHTRNQNHRDRRRLHSRGRRAEHRDVSRPDRDGRSWFHQGRSAPADFG